MPSTPTIYLALTLLLIQNVRGITKEEVSQLIAETRNSSKNYHDASIGIIDSITRNFAGSVTQIVIEQTIPVLYSEADSILQDLDSIKNSSGSVDISQCLGQNEEQLNNLKAHSVEVLKHCGERTLDLVLVLLDFSKIEVENCLRTVDDFQTSLDDCDDLDERCLNHVVSLIQISGLPGIIVDEIDLTQDSVEHLSTLTADCRNRAIYDLRDTGRTILGIIRRCVDAISH